MKDLCPTGTSEPKICQCPTSSNDLSPIKQLLASDIDARELCHVLDDVMYEYSYYTALNEEAFPECKNHMHYLRKLRNAFGAICHCMLIV